MPLPTKLAIFITFHCAETRLPYLRTICQECRNLGQSVKAYLFTKAAAKLRAAGKNVRVVSMPCVELFEEQDAAYRESVLPSTVRKRLVVEASSSFGWHKYAGFEGDTASIDRYGASAPGPLLMEMFGFTVANVVAKANTLLA